MRIYVWHSIVYRFYWPIYEKRKLNERSGACETLRRLDYKPLFGKERRPDSREWRSKMFKCQLKKCLLLLFIVWAMRRLATPSSEFTGMSLKLKATNISIKLNSLKKSQLARYRPVGYLQALQRSKPRSNKTQIELNGQIGT